MAEPKLYDFVKESLQAGQERAKIKDVLERAGWRTKEIEATLTSFADSTFPIAVPKPKPYLSAREAFLYLFFFILLGIVSINLGLLLFSLIDYTIQDSVEGYELSRTARSLRGGIAGLVVSLPIFLLIARILQKSRRTNPEMQRSRIRKWLTYLSLVIAGCTLVGDAISLLTQLLNGDLTLRFTLKALVIGGIAGGIFFYFIGDAEHGDDHDQQAE